MVEIQDSDLSGFVKAEFLISGDLLLIVGEGEIANTNFGRKLQLPIKIRGKPAGESDFKYSPNQTTLRELAKAWGKDTAKWVNKYVMVELIATMIRGERTTVIYGHPVDSETDQPIGQPRKPQAPAATKTKDLDQLMKDAKSRIA